MNLFEQECDVTYVDTSAFKLAEFLREYFYGLQPNNSFEYPLVEIDFSKDVLELVQATRFGPRKPLKILVWSPLGNSDLSIVKTNSNDGSHYNFQRASKRTLWLWYCISLQDSESEYHFKWSCFGKNGEVERVVKAYSNDYGKMRYFEKGQPLSIEDLSYAAKRSIKDRMNRNIIKEYFDKLGFPRCDEDFSNSVDGKAYLICRDRMP